MTKHIAPPLDENTRRYYLDVMGVQCWQSLEAVAQQNDDRHVEPEAESEGGVSVTGWLQLEQDIHACQQCVLHKTRKQALSGRGNQSAGLMFVLLAPDASDDSSGQVCSDAAGDLFTRMLAAIDVDIDDVYISSLLKCALPASHTVTPKEIHCCTEYLKRQVQLIRPELIVVLGETAIRCLLQKDLDLDDYRAMNPGRDGKDQPYQFESVPLFVTYSPHDLLQQVENKRKAWSDLQQLQAMMIDRA
jgi:uracil-DNA glycosylase family 4